MLGDRSELPVEAHHWQEVKEGPLEKGVGEVLTLGWVCDKTACSQITIWEIVMTMVIPQTIGTGPELASKNDFLDDSKSSMGMLKHIQLGYSTSWLHWDKSTLG